MSGDNLTPYQRGISDYLNGRPFSPSYERWSEAAQESYERGRLVGAARARSGSSAGGSRKRRGRQELPN